MLLMCTMLAQKGFALAYTLLGGDKTQLKPCRFAYILSLCTQEGKETFTPLFHDVCDGFKIVDNVFKVSSLSYDCKNY